jgi:hypothetical protein
MQEGHDRRNVVKASAVMIVSVINVSVAIFVKWISCVSLEYLLIVAL